MDARWTTASNNFATGSNTWSRRTARSRPVTRTFADRSHELVTNRRTFKTRWSGSSLKTRTLSVRYRTAPSPPLPPRCRSRGSRSATVGDFGDPVTDILPPVPVSILPGLGTRHVGFGPSEDGRRQKIVTCFGTFRLKIFGTSSVEHGTRSCRTVTDQYSDTVFVQHSTLTLIPRSPVSELTKDTSPSHPSPGHR